MQRLVAHYLSHRRQLGYEMSAAGILLRNFARFADRVAPGKPLTVDLGLRWALAPKQIDPHYRDSRINALRGRPDSGHGGGHRRAQSRAGRFEFRHHRATFAAGQHRRGAAFRLRASEVGEIAQLHFQPVPK